MWAMRLSIEFSLAAIMALILFFVAGKNNTVLNVILLAALFGFCLHPVLSLRWITAASPFAIKERRTLVAVAITLIVVVGFGIWVWPSQSESTAKIVTPSGSQPAGGPKQPPDTPASCPVVPELTDEQKKVNPKDQLNYVRIPNGKFMMGCPDGSECNDYEKPQHLVTIRKGFWMGQSLRLLKRHVISPG